LQSESGENGMAKAGSYAYLPLERVVFGRPAAAAAVAEDVMQILQAAW
jgi:hypothetical protein